MINLHQISSDVATKCPVCDVISTVARLGAFGWYKIFLWKLLQSDVFILLDQCNIN